MSAELSISGIGSEAGIYRYTKVDTDNEPLGTITMTITYGEKLINWSNENLGYVPKMFVKPRKGIDALFLIFRDDTDMMLFKVNFGHLWQERPDE